MYKDATNKQRYVGFLFNPPQRMCSWTDFRLRDPNNATISQSLSVVIVRVFFPLISVIIPKWISLHGTNDNDDSSHFTTSPPSKAQHSPSDDDINHVQITQPLRNSDSEEIAFFSSNDDGDDDNENNDNDDNDNKYDDDASTSPKRLLLFFTVLHIVI